MVDSLDDIGLQWIRSVASLRVPYFGILTYRGCGGRYWEVVWLDREFRLQYVWIG